MILSQSGCHLSYQFHGDFLVHEPEWFNIRARYEEESTRIGMTKMALLFFFFLVMMAVASVAFLLEFFVDWNAKGMMRTYSGKQNMKIEKILNKIYRFT